MIPLSKTKQPRVIIYINFVVLESQNNRFKFQCNQLSVSGEEENLRFSQYKDLAASWSCDKDQIYYNGLKSSMVYTSFKVIGF